MDIIGIIFLVVIAIVFAWLILSDTIFKKYYKKKEARKNDMKFKISDMEEIAKIIDCDTKNPKDIELLSIYTASLVGMFECQEKKFILCTSDLSCCDALFFAEFCLSALCIRGSLGDVEEEKILSRMYAEDILKIAQTKYSLPRDTLKKMYTNRIGFYSKIYLADEDKENIFKKLVEEFEYIVKTDYIDNEYKPFSASSPLPILGFEQEYYGRAEVYSFFEQVMRTVKLLEFQPKHK